MGNGECLWCINVLVWLGIFGIEEIIKGICFWLYCVVVKVINLLNRLMVVVGFILLSILIKFFIIFVF